MITLVSQNAQIEALLYISKKFSSKNSCCLFDNVYDYASNKNKIHFYLVTSIYDCNSKNELIVPHFNSVEYIISLKTKDGLERM